jgi:N-acyl-D-amino-acid deacylase
VAFDLIIRGGTVYDGSGSPPVDADVAIAGDQIAGIGDFAADAAAGDVGLVLDARGMAVAPGFINMLSHSYVSILLDPRSLGELKQGVTTQIFGEGSSMGPWTDAMHTRFVEHQARGRFDVPWTRLSEYLAHVEQRGASQNVASYIGATTLRINAVGYDARPASDAELDRMRALVAEEMADGALGIGSALIYPPAFFAGVEELTALCLAAAPYGGRYISHLRSEGNRFVEAVEELLTISRDAEVPAEIYHLKAAGPANWPKMDTVVDLVEAARAVGEPITADVYTYTAGATALYSAVPPWFHDGGVEKLYDRLADPVIRSEVKRAILLDSDEWENLYLASGGAEGVLILSCRAPDLRDCQARTLAAIAADRGADPVDTLIDLLLHDRTYIGAAYFIIDEDNLRRQIQLPWVSVGSDAASQAAEGEFLESSTHPRSYGTFARFLGTYVREEKLISLEEGIRRLTSLPAANLGLARRGALAAGNFADVVVFDRDTVAATATYESPHSYAIGVRDVIVNGSVTLRDGEFTGSLAGRALRPNLRQ